MKPIDAMKNLGKYICGLPAFYCSYYWWYVIITIYSMCNLDDVSWGNRPNNASKGLNVVVDDKKRQEILKESYRTTRTNILIWWLIVNIGIMYTLDAVILSAVHNQNKGTRETCQSLLYGYAWYNVGNNGLVLGLAIIHTVIGNIRLISSSYNTITIKERPVQSGDPETKVLLDDEDDVGFANMKTHKKKFPGEKAGIETDEDASMLSQEIDSDQFL